MAQAGALHEAPIERLSLTPFFGLSPSEQQDFTLALRNLLFGAPART
jgi:hypothetical protein